MLGYLVGCYEPMHFKLTGAPYGKKPRYRRKRKGFFFFFRPAAHVLWTHWHSCDGPIGRSRSVRREISVAGSGGDCCGSGLWRYRKRRILDRSLLLKSCREGILILSFGCFLESLSDEERFSKTEFVNKLAEDCLFSRKLPGGAWFSAGLPRSDPGASCAALPSHSPQRGCC
ncbi:hypothetical protein I7I48_02381 [Histoplasma ohiense]|nr:hypothetical protein I7I48_02381 [Histoplasma ohiense (nom. inval.)]